MSSLFFSRLTSSWAALLTYGTLAAAAVLPREDSNITSATDGDLSTLSSSATSYDYIIVGGGLTGLVAANRLSENAQGKALPCLSKICNTTLWPVNAASLNTADMFNITSGPEPALGNRTYSVRAGSVPGGGSTVNGMELDRASAADYDSWELLGNPGWGWKGLLPYFKKASSEMDTRTHFTQPPADIQAQYNYTWDESAYGNGPLQASFPDFQYPDNYPFFDAFAELDIPFVREHAAGNAVGYYWTPASLDPKKKTRSSSLNAYYDPVSSRPKLRMLVEHQVTEILFNGNKLEAAGVKAIDRTTGKEVRFKANKEVILAAGAVHTPQILQLSGIGPKNVLQAAGIKVKLDFPAVGSNFQDHPVAYLNWNVTNSFPYPGILTVNATFYAEALALYLNNLTGPFTKAQASSTGFLSLEMITDEASSLLEDLSAQDATSYLPSVYSSNQQLLAGFQAQRKILVDQLGAGSIAVLELPFSGAGSMPNALQKPLSRGTVYLNATNPKGEPVVTHHAFENPFDKSQLYAMVQFTRKLMSADALASLSPVETLPGPQYQTPDEIFNVLASSRSSFGPPALGPTFAHPSSSCPMMPRKYGGVVGPDLLVYGTKKLSIIDSSILPIIPAAHLQASLYAVGEKAADLIKGRA
ncbi:uncharacterized protein Z518_06239 [Rhinocladiella mackenziei CBS 650.93]|uniref:Glucose-methanol-choline oxidoreductase N-terminal domain-containing protein n=1 Tax=Rhinocladiella mackenziei CBS 650.93 TaxID=1442369 RepID=A0A0D2FTE4_9EURO|nr:uncharacterized protein Z518_06239 [Rhinocladiella mackenziei CBS 650.93]KIX05367.1 hypothetical protein Z518_06239 [Rhinocladiella mackenziei CBS 650.93]